MDNRLIYTTLAGLLRLRDSLRRQAISDEQYHADFTAWQVGQSIVKWFHIQEQLQICRDGQVLSVEVLA